MATFHAFQPLTCFACTKNLQEEHDNRITATPPRADKEDEEEFVFQGIPIAGENDGDSEASWERASWDQEDEDETDNITQNHTWLSPVQGVNLRATDDIAFRIGPKKDGVIQVMIHSPIPLHTNPYGQLLSLSDDITSCHSSDTNPLTSRALELQRLAHHGALTRLTNAHRLAQTVGSEWRLSRKITNLNNQQRLDQILDLHVAYINNPMIPNLPATNPPWSSPTTPRSRTTLYQCMNNILHLPVPTTITSPRTPPDQPIRKVTFNPTIATIPDPRNQTIPGTPDQTPPRIGNNKSIKHAYLRMLLRTRARRRTLHAAPGTTNTKPSKNTPRKPRAVPIPTNAPPNAATRPPKAPSSDSDSDQSTDLYFRAQANHRPEMGESNAESVLRGEKIKQDVKRMRHERKSRRKQTREKQQSSTLNNYVTDITLQTDYSLYENPETYSTPQPIPLIYDTGAAISMLSSEPSWAWTNLRDCMFNLGGCFSGPTVQNLQMGEYHGVMTLDSGETVRIIIPEAVQVPAKLSHSNLLANTPYLMAGHKFHSDLHKPKLKFKGRGQYTMAVTKGHNLLSILPIHATKDSTH